MLNRIFIVIKLNACIFAGTWLCIKFLALSFPDAVLASVIATNVLYIMTGE